MDHADAVKCSSFAEAHTFLSAKNGQSFRLAHVNIRSVHKHWDHFLTLTSPYCSFFDVFVLTEINVPSFLPPQYNIPGFQSFSYTRPIGRGGGVAVFIKDNWSVSECSFAFLNAEVVALRMSTPELSLVLISVYRPPCCNGRLFLEELDCALASLAREDNICMAGDININTLRPNIALVGDYLDTLSKFGLQNTIQSNTREEMLSGRLVSSCIDHINVRVDSLSVKSAIVETKLADHYFVCSSLTKETATPPTACGRIQISLVDPKVFDKVVEQHDWQNFILTTPHSTIYADFVALFNQFKQLATRVVTIRQRNSHNTWMTREILAAIKEKDILWAQSKRAPNCVELRSKFRQSRNRVNAMIRLAKRKHFRKRFWDARSDSRKTWSLLNCLRGNTKQSHNDDFISTHFSSPGQTSADNFNKYFSQVTGSLRQNAQSCSLQKSIINSAYLPLLTEDELRTILYSLKPNKSPGIDNISINDLRRNFATIKHVLLTLLNAVIASGVIPINMKTAVVRPLFKAGARNKIENYRPISVLSCIGQLLESHMLRTMTSFLEVNDVLSSSQYGFIRGKGTQVLLEEFSDMLNSSFEHNKVACALLLDLSKAFDSVCHKLLLNKLSLLGFRGPFLLLLENYLHGRRQCVKIGRTYSDFTTITAGVPQGSILSPLLFNIYVNDLSSHIALPLFQYADDTLILSVASNYSDAILPLQATATKAMDWFAANVITVNTSKTRLICFHNPLKKINLAYSFFLHTSDCFPCNCTSINCTNTVKYLGVHFDSDLSWNTHLAYVCRKLRAVSCLLYNIRYLMPMSVRKTVVHALAYSVLRYGVTVYGFCALRWKNRIDSILRSLLRNVAYDLDLARDVNIFAMLSMPNFDSLLLQTIVLKHYWSSSFKTPYIPTRCLRPKEPYLIPRCATRYGKRSRIYYVPHAFNQLPPNYLSFQTKYKLRKALRHYIV